MCIVCVRVCVCECEGRRECVCVSAWCVCECMVCECAWRVCEGVRVCVWCMVCVSIHGVFECAWRVCECVCDAWCVCERCKSICACVSICVCKVVHTWMEGNQLVASFLFSFYVGVRNQAHISRLGDTFFNWLNHLFALWSSFFFKKKKTTFIIWHYSKRNIFPSVTLLVHSRPFYNGIVNVFGFSCCSVSVMAAHLCACSIAYRKGHGCVPMKSISLNQHWAISRPYSASYRLFNLFVLDT